MKAGPLSERFCGLVVRESLVALSYLHKSGIIHRDIKAANILLTVQGRVLLCDFGVAASLVSSSVHAKRSTFVGTPYWMAPEVITEGKTYDQSADIWSLGITLYEMACGNPPHAEQEQMRAIMLIPKSKPPRLPVDGNFSPLMRDFLAMCLNEEPREVSTACRCWLMYCADTRAAAQRRRAREEQVDQELCQDAQLCAQGAAQQLHRMDQERRHAHESAWRRGC